VDDAGTLSQARRRTNALCAVQRKSSSAKLIDSVRDTHKR